MVDDIVMRPRISPDGLMEGRMSGLPKISCNAKDASGPSSARTEIENLIASQLSREFLPTGGDNTNVGLTNGIDELKSLLRLEFL